MGNTQTKQIDSLIAIEDILNSNDKAISNLAISLEERSYGLFTLSDKQMINNLNIFSKSVNSFYNLSQDIKNKLENEEGNVGYIKGITREFLKLRSCDIESCKNNFNDYSFDKAEESLNHLQTIAWECFLTMHQSALNPISDDDIKELEQCLKERASMSVIHYFPATVAEGSDNINEKKQELSDSCNHIEDSFEICSEHMDTGIFTLIMTSNVPGLELYDTKLNTWLPIEKLIQPYRNTNTEVMILLMGHKAPLFLGERCQPTLHRVTVQKGIERPSFLYFMDTAKIN